MPQKVRYSEEGTTRRGPASYKITYEYSKEAPKDVKEKIPVYFLRHVMQHTINLSEEKGPDIGYSEFKVRHFPCRVEVTFLKYGGLHPMSLGQEEDRYEEVWEEEVNVWVAIGSVKENLINKKKLSLVKKRSCIVSTKVSGEK